MVINGVTTVGNWGRPNPEGAGRSWGKDASCSTLWPIDIVPTTIYVSSIYPLDEMGEKLLTVAGSEIADMCRERRSDYKHLDSIGNKDPAPAHAHNPKRSLGVHGR